MAEKANLEEVELQETVVNDATDTTKRKPKGKRKLTKKTEKKTVITFSDDDKYELVELWEGESVLYDITDDDYRDKNKRSAAFKRIIEEMTLEGITETDVNNCMKNLRTQYLKEKRKTDDSVTTGKGTNDLYISKWKFYAPLSFLHPYCRPIASQSNLRPGFHENNFDEFEEEEEEGVINSSNVSVFIRR